MVVRQHEHSRLRGNGIRRDPFSAPGSGTGLHAVAGDDAQGVMHQFVHAKAAGIPLLGDQLYGGGTNELEFSAQFALHHRGLSALKPGQLDEPGIRPAPLPLWWPSWAHSLVMRYSTGGG